MTIVAERGRTVAAALPPWLSGQLLVGADGVQLRRAQQHFVLARGVLARFGWQSEPSKEVPPCTDLETLGVHIDLRDGRLRLGDGNGDGFAPSFSVRE